MLLKTYPLASDFLERAGETLMQHEARNALIFGLTIRLRDFPERIEAPPYLATIEDGQRIVLATCITAPPRNLVLAGEDNVEREALELIARNLLEQGWPLRGVFGPNQLSEDFASIWTRVSGKASRQGTRERAFELRQVIAPRPAPGRLRVCTEADQELILAWMEAFMREALPEENTSSLASDVRYRLADRAIYVWELPDGQAVTMAMKNRPVVHGISIGGVYTPPAQRGKGYASNCVATLSQLLLDSGWQWCGLFTDLSNPTSNSIYQKIGYRPIGDFVENLF